MRYEGDVCVSERGICVFVFNVVSLSLFFCGSMSLSLSLFSDAVSV